MAKAASQNNGGPLIVIGDRVKPTPYLVALMQQLRAENAMLDAEAQIRYAVCTDSTDVALALRRYADSVRMVLIGPGLGTKGVTVARMLSGKANIVMVVDPAVNPLGLDPASYQQVQVNLEALGVVLVTPAKATAEFFEPLVNDYVVAGLSLGSDLESMSPQERGQVIDQRLDAVNKFPAMPDTQRQVAELNDLDPPKRWAAAIDPDTATRTVILKLLNSARYGFRSRVETIEQAVALASARTIREIVTACQVRQIFRKTAASTIDQFWRHALAVAFFAKLFALPADPAGRTKQQTNELERFHLEPEQLDVLAAARISEGLDLEDAGDAFTAGLLHDLGKVTMLMCLEDSLPLLTALIDSEIQQARAENRMWAQSLVEIERLIMGDLDHQVIGGRLAERWELPDHLTLVIGHHHDVSTQSSSLLKVVALANLAGSTLFPYPATTEQHPFPLLFARIHQAIKRKADKSLPDAVEEAISQDVFEDLAGVLNRLQIPECLWQLVDFKSFFKVCYMVSPNIKSATVAFLQQTG